jgi:hypothetical protein
MWIVVALAAWLLAIALCAVGCRIVPVHGRLTLFIASAIAAAIVVFGGLIGLRGWMPDLVAALLCFVALSELYLFLMTLTNSVTVKLVSLLCEKKLGDADIHALYDGTGIIAKRLDLLADAGLLARKEGHFALTRKGARAARCFDIIQRLFGHAHARD